MGLVTASYAAAILLRFEFSWPAREAASLVWALPALLVCRLGFFARYHLFRGWWQYVGLADVVDIAKSTTAGSLAFLVVVTTTGAFPGFPRSVFLLEWLLTLQFVAGARVLSRLLHSLTQRLRIRGRENVLLVGSGPTSESTLRELVESPSALRPIGFLDDGGLDRSGRLRGIPCLGPVEALERVLSQEAVSEVFVALPAEPRERMREIIRCCRAAGVRFRILSSVQERLDQPRAWDLADLEQLFDPETIATSETVARRLFYQKTVLVLGASGQIGSALAWEIAGAGPHQLLLFDRNESPLYYLEVEFLKRTGLVPVTPIIGDVLDEDRLRGVFEAYRPDVVIHGAQYTRPELLATSRDEMLENNLRGTETVLRRAVEAETPRVFLLSGDESDSHELACAHRAAEALLRSDGRRRDRIAAAVRFPNVLGSPGCLATRAARALQERRALECETVDARVRIASRQAVVALLIEAFDLAEDGDVLAIQTGRTESLQEILRYLAQVWNLPEIPLRRPLIPFDHGHRVESGLATGHPRVIRRKPDTDLSGCARRLLEELGRDGTKGGSLLANSSGR